MPKRQKTKTNRAKVKAQYEALGRFVEAFEAMVDEARAACVYLQTTGASSFQASLIAIPLYHPAFAAKSVFESFRAVLMEALGNPAYRKKHKIKDGDIVIFAGVLSTISREYEKLASLRNHLLHGTWQIGGRRPRHLRADEIRITKFVASGKGMTEPELPKNTSELLSLRDRCVKTRNWITRVTTFVYEVKPRDYGISQFFEKRDDRWFWLGDETLP